MGLGIVFAFIDCLKVIIFPFNSFNYIILMK